MDDQKEKKNATPDSEAEPNAAQSEEQAANKATNGSIAKSFFILIIILAQRIAGFKRQ